MATNYKFPHVAISKYAVPRVNPVEEPADVPILFAPFRANKGPSNEFRMVYTLGEFSELYGFETFEDYSDKQFELLNISNWLSNGGAVLALRMTHSDYDKNATINVAKDASGNNLTETVNGKTKLIDNVSFKNNDPEFEKKAVLHISAKYPGIAYKNLKVLITKLSKGFQVSVVNSSTGNMRTATEYERFNFTLVDYLFQFNNSQYIKLEKDDTFFKTLLELEENDGYRKFIKGTSTTEKGTIVISNISIEGNSTTDELLKYSHEKSSFYVSFDYMPTVENKPEEEDLRDLLLVNFANAGINNESVFDPENEIESRFGEIQEIDTVKTLVINDYYKVDTKKFPSDTLRKDFGNKLEYPCDVFMDAAYSYEVKSQIIKELPDLRDDIHFFMDVYSPLEEDSEISYGKSELVDNVNELCKLAKDADDYNIDLTNISFYAQSLVVSNTYTDNDIEVGPTYFLSSLIPENYFKYGIQYPVAGLTRGVITGIKSISENPDPATKNMFYDGKINYIEKDSRGYKFMCQLTRGLYDTALTYVNNSRTTSRIARDIETIGRKYLFEFNDTTTLSNMNNEMNKYLGEWVQKRTLSYFNLELNSVAHNKVEVNLGIKFTGTIEIIAVHIEIE